MRIETTVKSVTKRYQRISAEQYLQLFQLIEASGGGQQQRICEANGVSFSTVRQRYELWCTAGKPTDLDGVFFADKRSFSSRVVPAELEAGAADVVRAYAASGAPVHYSTVRTRLLTTCTRL
jgi:hypothetical protein